MKITIKEQSENRERKKKSYLRGEKNLVRDHSFMTSAISTSIQFLPKDDPLLGVLNCHSITLGSFGIFFKNLLGLT